MLDLFALALAVAHFGVPLAYYWYAKTRWLPKPWNLKIDDSYRPRVTVILPTYNEAKYIQARLDNIREQDYPRELLEVIVVDSASSDGTPQLVEEWGKRYADLKLKLVREEVRRGKARALNLALQHATGEVIVIADADALWPPDALGKAVKWLSDPTVGAVSCLKKPLGSGPVGIEEGYRQYYNVLRVAESKVHSTPIFHGELAAFKTDLLRKLGGFPTHIGADDSHTAARIALMGCRAIIPENLWVSEAVPKNSYTLWRIRRAQHLVQHFARLLKEGSPKPFNKVLLVESYLHLANPWLLAAAATLLTASALRGSLTALLTLAAGSALLVLKPFRTWVTTQALLVAASIRNLYSKEIAWKKQSK